MKRILIIFGVLLCLGVSVPFADAADSFDVNKSLKDNLNDWTALSANSAFKLLSFGSASEFDIAMVYTNPDLMFAGSANSDLVNVNGFSVLKNVYLAGRDLTADFLGANGSTSAEFFMFRGSQTLAYEWDGNLINLVPGTVFVGFNLGGGSNMDLVLALSPAGSFQPVPLPAAALLLGSGLTGLAVLRRKLA